VLFEYEPQKTDVLPQSCIGVEYSDKGLFTDSNGREIGYPPYIQKTIKETLNKAPFTEQKSK